MNPTESVGVFLATEAKPCHAEPFWVITYARIMICTCLMKHRCFRRRLRVYITYIRAHCANNRAFVTIAH